jgi:hypothetical protein
MSPENKTLYPCTGTKDRLGIGYEEKHVYLVYIDGVEQYLTYDQAIEKFGMESVEVHPRDGTICPECTDLVLSISQISKKHGVDLRQKNTSNE